MNEAQALRRMVPPGQRRPGKWRGGVIQVWVTRACDKSCFGCTQGSNLAGKPDMMTVANFERALRSLEGYWGVVGMFGGNPAMHPEFATLCLLMQKYVPREQRGIWCNNPIRLENAALMRQTFNPSHSNLNVHLDRAAYDLFKRGWPECHPVGLEVDSRHSPPYVAMKDLREYQRACPDCVMGFPPGDEPADRCRTCGGSGRVPDEEKIYEKAANCDINQHWSAMIGQFRGEPRAWFCEIAGAQAMLHQWDLEHCPGCWGYGEKNYGGQPGICDECDGEGHLKDAPYSYPDTGYDIARTTSFREDPRNPLMPKRRMQWWELPMQDFAGQVRKHCFECSVPLRGRGELAQADDSYPGHAEQTSETHRDVYRPKHRGRRVELVTVEAQLGPRLGLMTDYIGNAKR